MRKTYLVVAAILPMLFSGTPARAIDPTVLLPLARSKPIRAIDLYGFASYWNQNDLEGAKGTGLGANLSLIAGHLRLDGRVYFFEDSDAGPGGNLDLTPLDLGAQIHLMPDGTLDPYFLGGVSYLWADADKFDADSTFGGYLGAGLDVTLPIPLFSLFGEALYRFSEIDNPFGDDIDAGGFTGNMGIRFHF